MGLFKKKQKKDFKDISFKDRPYLNALRPNEKYVFTSDCFKIDGKFARIMSFFHKEGATDVFGAFWGVNRIPSGLSDDVVTILFDQVSRKTENWIIEHQKTSEGVVNQNTSEQGRHNSHKEREKNKKESLDLAEIAKELQNGASYLHLHSRLLVKADTLESLDMAVTKIETRYVNLLGTLTVDSYPGEQRQMMGELFKRNDKKRGRGFYFTSREFAGMHCLVTNGLSDSDGEYVGSMMGDVNNSAVLFNVNGYERNVVIANSNFHQSLDRVYVSDVWGSKLSQASMLDNGKVVHIILDGCDLDRLGPGFSSLTSKVDLQKGDVNMFEFFGDAGSELSIFSTQIEKIKLMAEQAFEPTDSDRSIIRGSLEDILTKFYVSQRMWYYNAKENEDKLRLFIPHEEVPRLSLFKMYLDKEYKALTNMRNRDDELLHAISVLRSVFTSMLTNNGDLFDKQTSTSIDGVRNSLRCIYDLSDLERRGKGLMMAQLVNIIGYAVGNLDYNDTVIIHGTEKITSKGVKEYLNLQFEALYQKGVRTVFLYNSVEKMIDDKDFNEYDKADYTILGNMKPNTLKTYQEKLGESIPTDMNKLLTSRNSDVCYIRRGYTNVIFKQDLLLGLGVKVKKKGVKANGKKIKKL